MYTKYNYLRAACSHAISHHPICRFISSDSSSSDEVMITGFEAGPSSVHNDRWVFGLIVVDFV